MDVALLLLRDRGERRRFSLPHDVVTIGRREDCDLRIPLGDVSRKHCSIIRSGNRLVLQDLGSSNGTYVNGERVQEAQLRAGDQLRIGSLRFVVQIDGQPAETDVDEITTAPADALRGANGGPGHADPLNPTAQIDVADLDLDSSDEARSMNDLFSEDEQDQTFEHE